MTLGYVIGANAAGNMQWTGGGNGTGGGGIEIEPPFYPATLVGFEIGIAAGSTDGFTIRAFDDDGADNGPGTELLSESIPPGGYIAGAWSLYDFETPVTINDGSMYLGWYMEGNSMALLTESEGPLSNRSYEILSNAWAKYRTGNEIMLRAVFENPFFVSYRGRDPGF